MLVVKICQGVTTKKSKLTKNQESQFIYSILNISYILYMLHKTCLINFAKKLQFLVIVIANKMIFTWQIPIRLTFSSTCETVIKQCSTRIVKTTLFTISITHL